MKQGAKIFNRALFEVVPKNKARAIHPQVIASNYYGVRFLHILSLRYNASQNRGSSSLVGSTVSSENIYPSWYRRIENQKTRSGAQHMSFVSDKFISSVDLRDKLKEHIKTTRYWWEKTGKSLPPPKYVETQDELKERTMEDSFQEVVIPLRGDLKIRDKYLTFLNTIRMGKLFEDMDTLAGWVGFKHCTTEHDMAISLVTASVDKIFIRGKSVRPDRDIKLTGFVSHSGKTSLEISIHIDQIDEDSHWHRLADATFVMVARDPYRGTGVIINRLIPRNNEDRALIAKGEEARKMRKHKIETSLFKVSPTAEEREVIHNLFLKTLDPKKSTLQTRVKPEGTTWMESTRLKNLIICHPQSRNLYNKIFGGHLMREAFELAWANTYVHIKTQPSFLCMDDVAFRKPVEIGSLLYLSSQIVYTEENYLQVRVHAEVVHPETGDIDTTNVFHFHFTSDKPFLQVMPSTYGEYMLYLDGQRHSIYKKTGT